jgi:hypothetical protein
MQKYAVGYYNTSCTMIIQSLELQYCLQKINSMPQALRTANAGHCKLSEAARTHSAYTVSAVH